MTLFGYRLYVGLGCRDWPPSRMAPMAKLQADEQRHYIGAARRRVWRQKKAEKARCCLTLLNASPLVAAAAFDIANPLDMNGRLRIQLSCLLNGRLLRRLDGKRLFDPAAQDGVTVRVFFDKKAFVFLAHKTILVLYLFRDRRDARSFQSDDEGTAPS